MLVSVMLDQVMLVDGVMFAQVMLVRVKLMSVVEVKVMLTKRQWEEGRGWKGGGGDTIFSGAGGRLQG